jgi:hypothetical protein
VLTRSEPVEASPGAARECICDCDCSRLQVTVTTSSSPPVVPVSSPPPLWTIDFTYQARADSFRLGVLTALLFSAILAA